MARDIIRIDDFVWKDYLSSQGASLPRLVDVEQVTDRVLRILAGNPGPMQLQGTNTYIVGNGKSRILIDSGEGMPIWIDRVAQFLRGNGLELAYILLTHWHGDHTGGVSDLINYDPSLADRVYKHSPDLGQNPLTDKQTFTVPGATLKAIYTPGHSTDHMCFLLEEENALFTGDNVLGHGFSVSEHLGPYVESLRLMRDLNCEVGFPAHGVKITDLPRTMDRYIKHEERREQKIFEVLVRRSKEVSSLSVPALIEAVHGDLPPEVVAGGFEPVVTQILWKLAEERKVGFEHVSGNRHWFLHKRLRKQLTASA